ncbi:MAG: hypothetical protein WA945_01625, partial [Arcobacteraceae bacterium]
MSQFGFRFWLVLSVFTTMAVADSYKDWLQSQYSEYTQYKKSLDEEFSDMLKKDWEEFQSMSTPSPYVKPKPAKIPTIAKPILVPIQEIKKSPIVTAKPIEKVTPPVTKKVVEKVVKIKDFNTANFTFYSTPISIQYDRKTQFSIKKLNKNSISGFWDMMSITNYKKLIEQINKQEKALNLNDWAKYQFIYKTGLSIFKNENNANLFTWFTLVKMHY